MYQKTITFTTPTTTDGIEANNFYDIGASVNTVVSMKAVFNTNGAWLPVLKMAYNTTPTTATSGVEHIHSMKYVSMTVFNNTYATSSNRNKVRITNSSAGYSGLTGYATIQYTKTS